MTVELAPRATPRRHALYAAAAAPLYITAFTDTFSGAFADVFPASMVVRAVLSVLFFGALFDSNALAASVKRLFAAVTLFLVLTSFFHFLQSSDAHTPAVELSSTLRLLYFPLLACWLLDALHCGRLTPPQLRHCVVLYGWLVLLSLILGKVTGLGAAIEGRGAEVEAGKGFMIGANEVGLMLMLSCPFVVADIWRRCKSLLLTTILTVPLYGWAAVYVFTKSSLFAPIVCIVTLYHFAVHHKASTRIAARLSLVLVALAASVVVWHFLEPIQALIQGTFFQTLFDDGVVAFLFRGRQNYIEAILPQLQSLDLTVLVALFGVGEHFVREISVSPLMLDPGKGTTFEMDLFDLLAAYGAIGTAAYALVVSRPLAILQRVRADPIAAPAALALGAAGVHALMAGHVAFSPQVTTLIALIVAAGLPSVRQGSEPLPAPARVLSSTP